MNKIFTKLGLVGIMAAGSLGMMQEANARGPWPTMEWVQQVGASGNEISQAIDVDAEGNVYSLAFFREDVQLSFGSTNLNVTKVGNQDYMVIKQRANGELAWAKTIQSPAASIVGQDIRVDKNGNVYVTGSFAGKVDFDPGTGVAERESARNSRGGYGADMYLLKFDSLGVFQWVRVAGSTSSDQGNSIAFDATHENVLVVGAFSGDVDFGFGQSTAMLNAISASSFVVKVKTNGDFVWAKGLLGDVAGATVTANAVELDQQGNVHVAGVFFTSFDADPGTNSAILTSVDHGDIFVVKLNASGEYVWGKSMGGVMYDLANGIAIDKKSNVYLTGSFQSNANFNTDGGSHFLYTKGGSDVFIAKLNDAGSMVWAYNMGSRADDAGNSIRLDEFDNLLIAGDFQSPTADFDPGPNPEDTFALISYGGYDGFVLKVNSDGKLIWVTNVGTKFGPDNANGVAVRNGYVYAVGAFYNTADFDPAGAGLTQMTSKGNADGFIMKLNDCHTFPNSEENPLEISGDSVICPNSTYTYAAPDLDYVVGYKWTLPSGWTGSSDSASIEVTAADAGSIQLVIYGYCDTVTLNFGVENELPEVIINVNGSQLSVYNPENYSAFQWYKDGEIINGATASTYDVTANGLYMVVVTGKLGCTDSATYRVNNQTSIDPVNELAAQISMYPNPAQEILKIASPIKLHLTISGIDGKIIRAEKVEQGVSVLNIQNLVPGVYMVRMENINGDLVKIEKLTRLN